MFRRSFISLCRSSNTIMTSFPPLIDIAVNLTDCVFVGVDWKGKQVHPSDYMNMLERAKFHGVEKCIISSTSLVQCARAIRLCREAFDRENTICGGTPTQKTPTTRLFCTVGVHPANSSEFLVPISDEERRYVIENGGLPGRLRGKDAENTATEGVTREQTEETDSADTTRSNTSDIKAQPLIEKEAAGKTTTVGSTTPPTTSILHYTTGGPLKFESIPEEHRTYWTVNNKSEFECERLSLLEELIEANRDIVAAVGECGMDGAELAYCPYDVQARYYKMQLSLAAKLKLPLFLHSRDCGMRFVEATKEFLAEPHLYCVDGSNPSNTSTSSSGEASSEVPSSTEKRLAAPDEKQSAYTFSHDFPLSGVVHSFTGDDEELTSLLEMNNKSIEISNANDNQSRNTSVPDGDSGSTTPTTTTTTTCSPLSKPKVPTNFYFGLNGSAFRTEASARRSVTAVPLDRLMLETDAPWCDIRKDNYGAQFIKTTFTTIKKEKMKQNVVSENDPFVIIERRNEPCTLRNVLECYVGCRGLFAVLAGSASDSGALQSAEKGLAVDGPSVSEQLTNGHADREMVSRSQLEHIAGQVYANTIALFPLLKN